MPVIRNTLSIGCHVITASTLSILLVLSLPANSPAAQEGPITATELSTRLGNDDAPLILDVRSMEEFENGHVPGALHIHYTELPGRISELPGGRDQEIVVYCEVGVRAGIATNVLEHAGFTRVRNLEGHMQKWRAENYPQE